MTVHKVETRWLKFLREQKNIKLKKSHCSVAMETPETAHEKIGTFIVFLEGTVTNLGI